MIKNLWNFIHVYCGCHQENVELQVHEGAQNQNSGADYLSAFYACPKYYEENRRPGEKACLNHISIQDYQDMVEHLSSILEAGMKEGISVNLQGLSWTNKRDVEFKVFEHSRDGIGITAVNKRAISH